MYYYLGAFVICTGLLYRYRYRVFFWTIWCVVRMMQIYKNYKTRDVKNNHLQFVTADRLSDNVVVCHYHGYVDEKEHHLKVIKQALNEGDESDDELVERILESLDTRNHIVHCSLVTPDESQMIDLTAMFREFVYHFDKDDDMSKMDHFFQYVNKSYNLDDELGDHKDLYFVIYLNDDKFTEVKYKVKEIIDHQFKEVLRLKVAS